MVNLFKENLKNELEYQDLTVKELSAKTGITQSTLGSYLGSRASMPTADIAVRIAQALNVSVEYLVTGHDEKVIEQSYEEFLPHRDILKTLNSLDKKKVSLAKTIINAISEWNEQS